MKSRFVNYFLIFMMGSFVGYTYEMCLRMGRGIEFINKGYSYGPYLPIYGYSLLILWFFNKKIIQKKISIHNINISPFIVFINVFFISTIFEYISGYLLELIFNKRWWDYTGAFLSINGYISLQSSIIFAIWGVFNLYVLIPCFNCFLDNKRDHSKNIFAMVLFCVYIVDFILSTISNLR